MVFFFILIPFLLSGQSKSVKAITTVNIHSLGPQKLGNLPPVIIPVNNTQSDLKILLGKQLNTAVHAEYTYRVTGKAVKFDENMFILGFDFAL